jgi:aspartate oxidase
MRYLCCPLDHQAAPGVGTDTVSMTMVQHGSAMGCVERGTLHGEKRLCCAVLRCVFVQALCWPR